MTFNEVFFYRFPQLFQKKVLGKFHSKYSFEEEQIGLNKKFILPSYTLQKIQEYTNSFSFEYCFFQAKVNLSSQINW